MRGVTYERKRRILNIANGITLLRFFAVPFFIGLMLRHRQACLSPETFSADECQAYRWIALGVFVLACISDAADGYIARRFKMITELGRMLDPLADKLLLDTAVLMLALPMGASVARFPFWFPLAVLSRDFILVLGTILVHLMHVDLRIQPSWLGKVTTVLQMGCVVLSLCGVGSVALLAAASATTVGSGLHYTFRGMRVLTAAAHETLKPHA